LKPWKKKENERKENIKIKLFEPKEKE